MDDKTRILKAQRLKAELAKLGIHTIDQLNEAIKKTKLDISVMADPNILPKKDKATSNVE